MRLFFPRQSYPSNSIQSTQDQTPKISASSSDGTSNNRTFPDPTLKTKPWTWTRRAFMASCTLESLLRCWIWAMIFSSTKRLLRCVKSGMASNSALCFARTSRTCVSQESTNPKPVYKWEEGQQQVHCQYDRSWKLTFSPKAALTPPQL